MKVVLDTSALIYLSDFSQFEEIILPQKVLEEVKVLSMNEIKELHALLEDLTGKPITKLDSLSKLREAVATIEKSNAKEHIPKTLLGVAYLRLWEVTHNEEFFRKAEDTLRESEDLNAIFDLGIAYFRRKVFRKAEEMFRRCLKYAPLDKKAQQYLRVIEAIMSKRVTR